MNRATGRTGSRAKPAAAGSRPASRVDARSLMRIKNLELRAKVVVEGFLSGLHRSPYHGFSVEFTEYRQYVPGDDPRFLDWRLYARSDRYYLKRFEDETNLRCNLLLDLSRSMSFGTIEYEKAEYAKTVAATIAYFLALQRDAVGLVTFDAAIRNYLPARFRPGHLHRLLMCLERSTAGADTDIATPLEQIARTSVKRGMVVLLSDMLSPIAGVEKQLGYLRSRGHEVVLVRVLDPAEVEFPFQDAAMFVDAETGRELYVDPQLSRQRYREKFATHADELSATCNRLGVDLLTLTTDRPLEMALFDFLSARVRRGRTVARRAGPARQSGAASQSGAGRRGAAGGGR